MKKILDCGVKSDSTGVVTKSEIICTPEAEQIPGVPGQFMIFRRRCGPLGVLPDGSGGSVSKFLLQGTNTRRSRKFFIAPWFCDAVEHILFRAVRVAREVGDTILQ